MNKALDELTKAMQFAMKIRPAVGGFPYLAEVLRQAGVIKNYWSLPSCQALYLTQHGPVVNQGNPLVTGMIEVPVFDRNALIQALRADQAGHSTFPEFLASAWKSGVIGYEVDFEKRQVIYRGALGETYVEAYPTVELADCND